MEVYRMRVFEKSVMRSSGLKRNEIIGWQKWHNEELHNLHSSSNIIIMIMPRRTRCSTHGEKRKAYRVPVGKRDTTRNIWL
jgi:hypothetical protein